MSKFRSSPSKRVDLQPALREGIDSARSNRVVEKAPSDPSHGGTQESGQPAGKGAAVLPQGQRGGGKNR